MYQTAVGRHGDRTRTADSGAVRNRARYHCAIGPVRYQHVSINVKKSVLKLMTRGIPQGSIFGPLHFISRKSMERVVWQPAGFLYRGIRARNKLHAVCGFKRDCGASFEKLPANFKDRPILIFFCLDLELMKIIRSPLIWEP